MAVASGPCPNCGSAIEFKAGSSISLVCKYCKHVVVRTDRDMRNMGRVADVAFSDAALAPGDRGTFRGQSFSIEGRLVLQHPAGGTWEEYYAVINGKNAWISEAQGQWQVVMAAGVAAPPMNTLRPQAQVRIGPSTFVVQELNQGTFLSGEGELPFGAAPGTKRFFADLSAAGGGWASIDYGDGQTQPIVYIGVQTSFAEFQVQQRGGDRPVGQKVATKDIKCPGCGAPLPVLAAGTERAACRHCNTISDVKLQQVVARQNQAREKPGIELGRRGVIPVADAKGVYQQEWIVLGYVERSSGYAGSDDWFGWQEYLLYNEKHGYRWLVFDEGTFYLITPLAAGDIDASRVPLFVRYRNLHFRRRNANPARVDFVLGEFYWKVEVGETVQAEDYEHGRELVSCERSASEVTWSHGVAIPTPVVVQAFGYQPKASAYGAAAYGGAYQPGRGGSSGLAIVIVVIILVLVFGMAACGACTGGGGSGSSSGSIRTGSSSGGFGGK